MIFLTGLSIIIIDQIIKAIVSINIPYGASIGNYIKLTNVANTGMAYGMRAKQTINYNNSKHYNYIHVTKISNKKL